MLVPYNPRVYERVNRLWALRILYRRASSLHWSQGYFKRTSYSDRSRPVPSADSQNAAPTADPTEPLAWACDRLPQPHGSSFAPLSFITFYEESLQPVKGVIRQAQSPYSSGAQVQVGSSGSTNPNCLTSVVPSCQSIPDVGNRWGRPVRC